LSGGEIVHELRPVGGLTGPGYGKPAVEAKEP